MANDSEYDSTTPKHTLFHKEDYPNTFLELQKELRVLSIGLEEPSDEKVADLYQLTADDVRHCRCDDLDPLDWFAWSCIESVVRNSIEEILTVGDGQRPTRRYRLMDGRVVFARDYLEAFAKEFRGLAKDERRSAPDRAKRQEAPTAPNNGDTLTLTETHILLAVDQYPTSISKAGIVQMTSHSRSTVWRTVKRLVQQGVLATASDGKIVSGPRAKPVLDRLQNMGAIEDQSIDEAKISATEEKLRPIAKEWAEHGAASDRLGDNFAEILGRSLPAEGPSNHP